MAKAEGQIFPLILADATDCTRLVCWGTITAIEVEGQSTRYTIENELLSKVVDGELRG